MKQARRGKKFLWAAFGHRAGGPLHPGLHLNPPAKLAVFAWKKGQPFHSASGGKGKQPLGPMDRNLACMRALSKAEQQTCFFRKKPKGFASQEQNKRRTANNTKRLADGGGSGAQTGSERGDLLLTINRHHPFLSRSNPRSFTTWWELPMLLGRSHQ